MRGEQWPVSDLVPFLRQELAAYEKNTTWAQQWNWSEKNKAQGPIALFADAFTTRHPHRSRTVVIRQVHRILRGEVSSIGLDWADELCLCCGIHMCDVWEQQFLAPGFEALQSEEVAA